MMMSGGDSGYVVRPHSSASGYPTVKLRVTNSQLDSARAVQWRYKRANGPWSIFLDQGDTAAGLAPGSSYAVNFKMKSASSPHRAPDNEPADLSETEKETLFVRWQH